MLTGNVVALVAGGGICLIVSYMTSEQALKIHFYKLEKRIIVIQGNREEQGVGQDAGH